MNYADRIRALREDRDIPQEKIAEILSISQRTYSSYETKNIRIPIDSIIILAKHYNVDMNYICGVSNEMREFPKK